MLIWFEIHFKLVCYINLSVEVQILQLVYFWKRERLTFEWLENKEIHSYTLKLFLLSPLNDVGLVFLFEKFKRKPLAWTFIYHVLFVFETIDFFKSFICGELDTPFEVCAAGSLCFVLIQLNCIEIFNVVQLEANHLHLVWR